MENKKYLTFKQLVSKLSEVRSKEELNEFCREIDASFQHEKITYTDSEMLYKIINYVVKRDFID